MNKLQGYRAAIVVCFLMMGLNGCSYYDLQSALFMNEQAVGYDRWLGKHRDERVKSLGVPDKCKPLEKGGQACEWADKGKTASYGSYEHRVVYKYDQKKIACGWRYAGSWGQRSHDICENLKSQPVASSLENNSNHQKENTALATDDANPKLDKWLGKHSSELVEVVGAPEKCHSIEYGWQICQWANAESSFNLVTTDDKVFYIYGPMDTACAWGYEDAAGVKLKDVCPS